MLSLIIYAVLLFGFDLKFVDFMIAVVGFEVLKLVVKGFILTAQ